MNEEVFPIVWKNLQICKVDDAGTLWLIERDTENKSREKREFEEFEKRMNDHYNSVLFHQSNEFKVNDFAVVCIRSHWYRCCVLDFSKNISKCKCSLLDYGEDATTDVRSMRNVMDKTTFSKVPFQAKHVKLTNITPKSLQYNFTEGNIQLCSGISNSWDGAANKLVKDLMGVLNPVVEFTITFSTANFTVPLPVYFGSLVLIVELTKKEILAKLTDDRKLPYRNNGSCRTLDLGELLFAMNYADHGNHLNITVISEEERQSTVVSPQPVIQLEDWSEEIRKDNCLPQTSSSQLASPSLLMSPSQLLNIDHHAMSSAYKVITPPLVGIGRGHIEFSNRSLNDLTHGSGSIVAIQEPKSFQQFSSNCNTNTPMEQQTILESTTLSNNSYVSVTSACSVAPDKREDHWQSPLPVTTETYTLEDLQNIPCPVAGSHGCIIDFSQTDGHVARTQPSPTPPFTPYISPTLKTKCTALTSQAFQLNYPVGEQSDTLQYAEISEKDFFETSSNAFMNNALLKISTSSEATILPITLATRQPQFPNSISELHSTTLEQGIRNTVWATGNTEAVHTDGYCLTGLGHGKVTGTSELLFGLESRFNPKYSPTGRASLLRKPDSHFLLPFSSTLMSKVVENNTQFNPADTLSSDELSVSDEAASSECSHVSSVTERRPISKQVIQLPGDDMPGDENNIPCMETYRQPQNSVSKSGNAALKQTENVMLPDLCGVIDSQNQDRTKCSVFCAKTKDDKNAVLLPQARKMLMSADFGISLTEVVENKRMAEVLINESVMNKWLGEPHRHQKQFSVLPLQGFMWPVICSGQSLVAIGNPKSGKTFGYVLPILSNIWDLWHMLEKRLPKGIGALMVVVCRNWSKVLSVSEIIEKHLPQDGPQVKVLSSFCGNGVEQKNVHVRSIAMGCDILVITTEFLSEILPNLESKDASENCNLIIGVLSRCVYLVFDDADEILSNNSMAEKHFMQILTVWGRERNENCRGDVPQQLIVTGSCWTKLLKALTTLLHKALSPVVLIFSPGESAIAAQVSTYLYLEEDTNRQLKRARDVTVSGYKDKKIIIFVTDSDQANEMMKLLKYSGIYSISVCGELLYHEAVAHINRWHSSKSLVMLVTDVSAIMLCQGGILQDADAIINLSVPSTKNPFSMRYSFMKDHFVLPWDNRETDCECYVIVTPEVFALHPGFAFELKHLGAKINREVLEQAIASRGHEMKKTGVLCRFKKAYGKCPRALNCCYRHYLLPSADSPIHLPSSGKVVFEKLYVQNCSRFFVRLLECTDITSSKKISLDSRYSEMYIKLQKLRGNQECLENIGIGDIFVAMYRDEMVRAKVMDIDSELDQVKVYLLDHGHKIYISRNQLFILPTVLADVPPFAIEVFLIMVEPFDGGLEWTHSANRFVEEFFSNAGVVDFHFAGDVALALDSTLWLRNVVLRQKIRMGAELIWVQKGPSLHQQLIEQGYGKENKHHIDALKKLPGYSRLTFGSSNGESVDFESENEIPTVNSHVRDDSLLCPIPKAALKSVLPVGQCNAIVNIPNNRPVLRHICEECVTLPDNASQIKDGTLRVGCPVWNESKDTDGNSSLPLPTPESTILQMKSVKRPGSSQVYVASVPTERLLYHDQIIIDIGEIISAKKFFVQLEDMKKELQDLEEKIQQHALQCIENNTHVMFAAPLSGCCIAKFPDDNFYYRAMLLDVEECDDSTRNVFFIDHGETILVSVDEVMSCPNHFLSCLPAQAILCCLVNIEVDDSMCEATKGFMLDMVDKYDKWIVQVVEVKDSENGPLYAVELMGYRPCESPIRMGMELLKKQLVTLVLHEGVEDLSDDGERSVSDRSEISLNEMGMDPAEMLSIMRNMPIMDNLLPEVQSALMLTKLPLTAAVDGQQDAPVHAATNNSGSAEAPRQMVKKRIQWDKFDYRTLDISDDEGDHIDRNALMPGEEAKNRIGGLPGGVSDDDDMSSEDGLLPSDEIH